MESSEASKVFIRRKKSIICVDRHMGRLKEQVPGSGLSSQEAVGAQGRQGQDRFVKVLLDFGPDIHSLGLDRMQLEVTRFCAGSYVPSRVPSLKGPSPRAISVLPLSGFCSSCA